MTSDKKDLNVIATIQEILSGRNPEFDASNAIKLVRHADNRKTKVIMGKIYECSLLDLFRYERGVLENYQREQKKGTFDKTEFIVVFLGEKGTNSRFAAVYKIVGKQQSPYRENEWIFDFQEVEEFKLLSCRIVIDWGKGTVSWHQDYREKTKAVIRVDDGFEDSNGVPRFVSFNDTLLSYRELRAIFENNDETWKSVLKSNNCIYMITDEKTGKQYVGSTYGQDGIWGRWMYYFNTCGHGGNKMLEDVISQDPDYARHFHWSILEILPNDILEEDAINRENLYKRKFMTREFGYNKN